MKSGKSSVFTRILRAGVLGVTTMVSAGLLASGCLDRPVSPSTPNTTNVFVDQIKQTTVDKIDLLFMIDNSISMADKQAFLKDAVPQLVNRLISPAIDPVTNKPEFNPVKNIHIGVITSSIGGHGGDVCAPGPQFNETQNDRAHLVPTVRAGLTSFNNLGFLWWDPDLKFGGEANAGTLISNFQAHVEGAGEQGCGYEASLEAWYRFLIDPDPPLNVNASTGAIVLEGVDDVLIQQRKDFLRADSLLSIIMLTDENDCSIADVGQNWIAAQASGGGNAFHLPRGTVACETDPNGACCRSCASTESAPPAGCGALSADTNCSQGAHDDLSDHLNLRCWNQRKRFGLDFLYPTRRYVDGLKNQQVYDHAGTLVANPLYTDFTGEGKSRDQSLVFFATIVGVPWQDIATEASLTDPNTLEYMTATDIQNAGRWKWLVPDCADADGTGICNVWNLADLPDDPLMIESTDPRTGTNPATQQALVPPSGGVFSPAGVPNGHEYNIPAKNDLQYACVFELPQTRDCASLPEGTGCDCEADPDPNTLQSPLCQQDATNYSTVQRFAKGYPGTRHLQVARDFGANSIVASICPKVSTGDPGAAAYGYNPAVSAIIDRLKEALNVKCINRPVSVKPDGTVQCAIVEVSPAAAGCNCDPNANRSEIDPVLVSPVLKQLNQAGQCGPTNPNNVTCVADSFCMCQINPAVDTVDCKTNPTPGGIGWCYVDPSQETDPNIALASEAIVADCNPKRLLRFIGNETPKPGSTTFIACLGAPVSAGPTGDGG